jgi:toxin ParE1/3/4
MAMVSPKAAGEMAERIRLLVDDLAAHPLIGREGRYLGTRELVAEKGRYVVVYRVRGQSVQIITVHNTRQAWPADWQDA